MADKIVVLRAGVIEQVGRPLELYDRPANIFVAGFIGSPAMNFVAATVSSGRLVAADADFGSARGIEEGRAVTCGIRPEHIRLDPAGFDADVLLVEPTGAETVLQLRLGESELTAVVHERVAAQVGDRLKISFGDLVHCFDEESGMRLFD